MSTNSTLEPWPDFLLRKNRDRLRDGQPPVTAMQGRAMLLAGLVPAEKVCGRWYVRADAELAAPTPRAA